MDRSRRFFGKARWHQACGLQIAPLALLLMSSTVVAQTGQGALTGRVEASETGRSLEGAIVTIANTPFREYTDATGRFVISGIPAGNYEVTITYVGHEERMENVSISTGQTTAVDASLDPVEGISTITVLGYMTGSARAINQQKTAAGIVNVFSEEQFGQMIDGNIGQALQRMPGLSVDTGQDGGQGDINIRGVSGEFNSVQIDGNRMPSSGGSNAFNPRQLAADGVTAVEVIKAPTPDRDGDAVGGIINLVTRSAFQRSGMEASVDVAGQLNQESDNWGHSASAKYSDIFSVGGSANNLGVSFSFSDYDTDRYSINADQDWVKVDPDTNPELNLDQWGEPVWFMEATHFEHDTRTTTTRSLSGSIDYRFDDGSTIYFRPMISNFEQGGVKYETDMDIDTQFQNAAGGRKTYAILTPTQGRATAESGASRGWIGTLEDTENDLYSFSFGGEYRPNQSVLSYDLFVSRNKANTRANNELNTLMEPEDPSFIMEYNIIDPRGLVTVDILNGVDPTDLSQMVEGELQENSGTKKDDVFAARLDWEREFVGDFGSLTFKTGAKLRQSSQFRDMTANVYEMDDTFPYAQILTPTDMVLLEKHKYFDVNPQAGMALQRSNPELFEFVTDDSLESSNLEDYDAEETISAAYAMGTYETGIHSIIFGVRFERYEWENTNKVVSFLEDEDGTVTPVEKGASHDFWLPGIHFRHALTDNLIMRESFNRSYGRPRLSELSQGRVIDDEGNISDGNTDLEPAESDNFDAQIEYYTDRGGLYSAGVFYKKISNFTFTETYNFNTLGANGIPIPVENGDFEYERPVNGTSAKNYGLELIARQRLYFLPGALQGLGVAVSATVTESKADYPNRTDRDDLSLEGFSKYLYTATLDYNWGKLSARLDYRYRDDYIEGLGSDIESDEFYAAEERFDAEVYYNFTDQFSLYATGTNLTDRPQVSYSGYSRFVEDASYSGRKFVFGARYEF
jgi:TonB-dependent receptor